MLITRFTALAGIALAVACFAGAPAQAMTIKECSTKYQAAKDAGTLNGMTWNDFRKAQCANVAETPDATTTKAKKASTTDQPAAATGLSQKECSAKYQAAKAAGTLNGMSWNDFRKAQCGAGAAATAEPASTKKKPAATTEQASGLSIKECSTKYQAAKAAGTLNGMSWNDFRKAKCAAGAAAEQPATATKTSTTAAGTGLTMKECSVKYQAAKEAGSLGGMKWNDFRKAKCSAEAADDETVPAPSEAEYKTEPEAPTTVAPKSVKFPAAIASKYTNESAGKARMHTCLDQYYANKEHNALGGLKWIQKGGGFYSLCNAKLKTGA